MKKSLMLIALAAVIGLTACGESTEDISELPEETTETTTETVTETTVETTTKTATETTAETITETTTETTTEMTPETTTEAVLEVTEEMPDIEEFKADAAERSNAVRYTIEDGTFYADLNCDGTDEEMYLAEGPSVEYPDDGSLGLYLYVNGESYNIGDIFYDSDKAYQSVWVADLDSGDSQLDILYIAETHMDSDHIVAYTYQYDEAEDKYTLNSNDSMLCLKPETSDEYQALNILTDGSGAVFLYFDNVWYQGYEHSDVYIRYQYDRETRLLNEVCRLISADE